MLTNSVFKNIYCLRTLIHLFSCASSSSSQLLHSIRLRLRRRLSYALTPIPLHSRFLSVSTSLVPPYLAGVSCLRQVLLFLIWFHLKCERCLCVFVLNQLWLLKTLFHEFCLMKMCMKYVW